MKQPKYFSAPHGSCSNAPGRELLPVYCGSERFYLVTDCRFFLLFIVNKPVAYALPTNSDRYGPRDYFCGFTNAFLRKRRLKTIIKCVIMPAAYCRYASCPRISYPCRLSGTEEALHIGTWNHVARHIWYLTSTSIIPYPLTFRIICIPWNFACSYLSRSTISCSMVRLTFQNQRYTYVD